MLRVLRVLGRREEGGECKLEGGVCENELGDGRSRGGGGDIELGAWNVQGGRECKWSGVFMGFGGVCSYLGVDCV